MIIQIIPTVKVIGPHKTVKLIIGPARANFGTYRQGEYMQFDEW